jgi:transcriptional regulator with XRE-family HTH domain
MDWASTIAEIQSLGYTQPQIAKICDCGQATISDLANGKTKDPRDSLGQALRRLRLRALEEAAAKATAAEIAAARAALAPGEDRRHDAATAAAYTNTLADRRSPMGES